MHRKAIIFGIKGTELTVEERLILKIHKPWGIVLFSRNIKNFFQLRLLINDIKNSVKDINYPILIDQEGGRVSRFNKIVDLSFFSQNYFGKLYKRDKKNFIYYYEIYIDTICDILKKVGININISPVLDVLRKKGHKVIGDRSFSDDPVTVAKLGNLFVNLCKKNKIATVIKHIPGHGLAKCDSHFSLPIIRAQKTELVKKDFLPFRKCQSLFAMTAHAIYFNYDPVHTATHSKIIINK